MRKIIASTYATLDGYIDNPHLWSLDYWSDEAARFAKDQLFSCDGLLMGRVTYEGFAASWPERTGDPFSDRINSMSKYVVTSTLEKADWNNTTVIPGDDLVKRVTELKEQPGQDILMYGIGNLTDGLMAGGLLDEYRIWVHPEIRGEGQPLFREGVKAKLKHLGTRTFESGVVILSYQPIYEG
ncbi:dihydrofolate reductase family protein [Streptosporangium lutulentum]|uniref:Dihydrofolate reductase n=1 Tax=Streptosporangium lutulentum TaxID=1461250 RepID=A0ABT9Q6M8_9ACTN|nr:dihydrofolate reductase family protein [Streptosporangium lutulentum]MDP9842367.1 dihydrofolate reductase [Streptosporangium lutulentum]